MLFRDLRDDIKEKHTFDLLLCTGQKEVRRFSDGRLKEEQEGARGGDKKHK